MTKIIGFPLLVKIQKKIGIATFDASKSKKRQKEKKIKSYNIEKLKEDKVMIWIFE